MAQRGQEAEQGDVRLAQRHSLLIEQIYFVLLDDFNVSGGQSVLKWNEAMLKKVRCVEIKNSPSAVQSCGCVSRILDLSPPLHTLARTLLHKFFQHNLQD